MTTEKSNIHDRILDEALSNIIFSLVEVHEYTPHQAFDIMTTSTNHVGKKYETLSIALLIDDIEKKIKKPLYQWGTIDRIEHRILCIWSIIKWKIRNRKK
jgi:hypothetical protein